MPTEQTISQHETQEVVDHVLGFCSDQAVATGTAAAWAAAFNAVGLDYEGAMEALDAFAVSPTFTNRSYRRIDHADIISMWHTIRRDRARTLVLPPPPDPDDPRAAIAHQRAVYDSAVSGLTEPQTLVPPALREASERRVRALRAGATVVDPARPPEEKRIQGSVREALERARKACAEAPRAAANRNRPPGDRRIPGPRRPGPAPAGSARASATHTDPLQGTATLGAALGASALGKAARRRGAVVQEQTGGAGSWCGRCHQDTGMAVALSPDGGLSQVPCCTPERLAAAG